MLRWLFILWGGQSVEQLWGPSHSMTHTSQTCKHTKLASTMGRRKTLICSTKWHFCPIGNIGFIDTDGTGPGIDLREEGSASQEIFSFNKVGDMGGGLLLLQNDSVFWVLEGFLSIAKAATFTSAAFCPRSSACWLTFGSRWCEITLTQGVLLSVHLKTGNTHNFCSWWWWFRQHKESPF